MTTTTIRSRVAETRLWKLLMTPVAPGVSARRRRAGKRQPHGIALFTVLIGLALMSSVVTDLGYNEMVRYKLAAHQRDAMKAQALAESGVNVARMLLTVQAAIQPMLSQLANAGIPLPAHTVWELIPLESDLMKSVANGSIQQMVGLDVSEQLTERQEALAQLKEDKLADFDPSLESTSGNEPYIPPEGGFGDFDGSFGVEIQDEERKAATLRGWQGAAQNERWIQAQRLFTVFQPERYDFLFEDRDAWGNQTDRYELIANIHDWLDLNEDATDPRAAPQDWGRAGGSSEDGAYTSYDLEPKNEYFDSHGELRLVRGFTDAHMKAFGDSISLYGKNKINILSAPPESVETLVRICANDPADPLLVDPIWVQRTVMGWFECKSLGMLGGGCQVSPKGFTSYLQTGLGTDGIGLVIDEDRCESAMDVASENFSIKATGVVGDVSRTLHLVVRVYGAIEERYYYSVVQ